MKPISKSKYQLAQLLIGAGVKQFPEDANWAAQDKRWNKYTKCAMFYRGADKPAVCKGDTAWRPFGDGSFLSNKVEPVALASLIPNWHQTVLSRDEFNQIVAETAVTSEPDSDGWIEWKGGACPVDDGVCVEIRRESEVRIVRNPETINWVHYGTARDIIAYRMHKPEQSLGSPIGREKFANGSIDTGHMVTTPTLDQLLQDWRNADDFAQRKQTEADEAAAMRDERWQAVQARAGEMGVTVGRCESVADVEPDDGWVEWYGGECPVPKGTFVDIRVRDGREELNLAANTLTSGRNPDASCAFWQHDDVRGDIVAYRLARP